MILNHSNPADQGSRLFRRFGRFGFFSRFGLDRSRRNRGAELDPFQDGTLPGVALALAELDDAGIASMPLFLSRGDLVKEDLHSVLLVQARSGEPPIMEAPAFAESDHFLRNGAGGFGLGQGSGNALVLDKAANEVGKHRIPVLTGAA